MSKLTEIKEGVKIAKEREITTVPIKTTDLEYLLSLLEEKDKALQQISDLHIRGIEDKVAEPHRVIARKALNTSSNTKGEI